MCTCNFIDVIFYHYRSCPDCRNKSEVWFISDKFSYITAEKKVANKERIDLFMTFLLENEIQAMISKGDVIGHLLNLTNDLCESFEEEVFLDQEILFYLSRQSSFIDRAVAIKSKMWQFVCTPVNDDRNQIVDNITNEQENITTELLEQHRVLIETDLLSDLAIN